MCDYDPEKNLWYGQCKPKAGSQAGSGDNECTSELITKCCNGSSPGPVN